MDNRKKLDTLPDELLLHLFSFLSPKDLTRVSQACKATYAVSQDNVLWKPHCTESSHEIINYREQYKKELSQAIKKRLLKQKNGDTLRYVCIADMGSSKTALIHHYVNGVLPPLPTPSIIGVDFLKKQYIDKDQHSFMIELWNTGEHERFVTCMSPFLESAACAIIFVEMQNNSLDRLQHLIDINLALNKSMNKPYFVTAIIGCYEDDQQLKLSRADLIQLADKYHIDLSLCLEVNIRSKEQIDHAFNIIHEKVLSIYKPFLSVLETKLEKKNSFRCLMM